jgi:hypothetical protein
MGKALGLVPALEIKRGEIKTFPEKQGDRVCH